MLVEVARSTIPVGMTVGTILVFAVAKICSGGASDTNPSNTIGASEADKSQCPSIANESRYAASVVVEGANGAIAVDSSGLYYAVSVGEDDHRSWRIRQRQLDGIEVNVVGPQKADIWQLAVDEKNVYFGQGRSLMRVNKKTRAITVLAPLSGYLGHLAVDTSAVYWSEDKDIYALPHGTKKPKKLATTSDTILSFLVHSARVYWLNRKSISPYQVASVSYAGGAAETTVAPDEYYGGVDGIGFDDTYMYWNEGKGFFASCFKAEALRG